MNRKITSIIAGVALLTAAVTMAAQSVNLAWDPSPSPEVNRYKVYAAKGTNTVFAAGNTNAAATVTVTNQLTASFTNLSVGAWTFTATAISTNGLESVNSNTVWTNVVPGAVINFRFAP